jgi:hypothetical protein
VLGPDELRVDPPRQSGDRCIRVVRVLQVHRGAVRPRVEHNRDVGSGARGYREHVLWSGNREQGHDFAGPEHLRLCNFRSGGMRVAGASADVRGNTGLCGIGFEAFATARKCPELLGGDTQAACHRSSALEIEHDVAPPPGVEVVAHIVDRFVGPLEDVALGCVHWPPDGGSTHQVRRQALVPGRQTTRRDRRLRGGFAGRGI